MLASLNSAPPGEHRAPWRPQTIARLRPRSRPYFSSTNAPCVLAWLVFRAPGSARCPPGGALAVIPRCLTIATSDSGGGAGIQADLKAFARLGCHGMSAIVALTAQSTTEVRAVHEAPPDFIRDELEVVFEDIGVDAAKTGMLFSAAIIETVADFLAEHAVPLVVDPVLIASSGARLLLDDTSHVEITVEWHDVPATHGAGCTHSATLAALLALGLSLEEAARGAAAAASHAVANGLTEIGVGEGPVDVLGIREAR